ncbi:hypothetical protein A0J48_000130 [Sphaerospermopsis aphanizomenoides BCCUSP55]|uniref:hypothetical protein n=1 Tax=Sphaerospermopsis aphanizomenoides TaxID=459663 RepID=UPI000AA750EE|nr:hypothetical protein [Sphaerospermopsis aphanizomenoides]MBK1985971.1 hypothetical protein [Sphaerospermopsis aphanizomenoides BCCUSP55]
MNSDLMPSPESSSSTASKEAPAKIDLVTKSPKPDNSPVNPSATDGNGNLPNRQQPIPPPSEPLQYRAIGLVRGCYIASSEQFTQGTLVTTDGVELNAVLLGRIMSLVKNHLDLEKQHLWVVYPRTRQENDSLHIQIVGVWEPENLAKNSSDDDGQASIAQALERPENGATKKSARQTAAKEEISQPLKVSSEIPDGEFSVRGEVVYQSFDAKSLVVKIKQAPRKPTEKPKYFKLKMRGVLATKAVGKFWDFKVKREADILVVETAEAIADLPKKRKPPFARSGPRPGGGPGRRPFTPRRNGETPRPVKKIGGDPAAVSKPVPKTPAPKPVKKPKPQDNS